MKVRLGQSADVSGVNPADERVILFCHCEIHVAGVRNVEVRPAINTDTDPNPNPNPNPNRIPNRKLSLLEMAENNITRSSAGLPRICLKDDGTGNRTLAIDCPGKDYRIGTLSKVNNIIYCKNDVLAE